MTAHPTTWAAVDLAALIAGEHPDDPPGLLRRDDGTALLYAGKVHALSGEPEAGKGWLALLACAERLDDGQHVLYLDFEDGPRTAVARLLALGAQDDAILARFHYHRPDEPLSDAGRDAIRRSVAHRPSLVVIDGVTEALALHGLDLNSNGDVAKWLALLPRPLAAATSGAVLLIDHVVKDKEGRGRYAIGAQHKLAGVDVAYSLEVDEPLGRGRAGRSTLTVRKDRPGHVRQHGDQAGHVAVLHLDARDPQRIDARLAAPVALDEPPATFRPTVLMERVSRALEDSPGLSKRALRDTVRGKNDYVDLALELLVAEHYVRVERDGQATRHHSLRPFHDPEGPNRAPVPPPCPDRAPGTVESHRAPVPLPLQGGTGAGHGHEGTPNGHTVPLANRGAHQ